MLQKQLLSSDKKITIGIPRALLYYKHKILWKRFFEYLGYKVVISHDTTKAILDKGISKSIDESCLSAKIFMGHVDELVKQKVEYIFVPRIAGYGCKERVCTKFFALYDIVKNTYNDIKLLDYNLDMEQGTTEYREFMKLGIRLHKNPFRVHNAYKKAKKMQGYYDNMELRRQKDIIEKDKNIKILIVAHPYNIYDDFIGKPILRNLEKQNVTPIFADLVDKNVSVNYAKKISSSLYWTYNKELIGSIEYYKDKIDGIIFLVTFPCGPDSLVAELCQRKIKDKPFINIVLDEHSGEVGLETRIESFIDIITMRKRNLSKNGGINE